jgi:DNA ligase D-like protein (predicted 3'-phosphoesterase)
MQLFKTQSLIYFMLMMLCAHVLPVYAAHQKKSDGKNMPKRSLKEYQSKRNFKKTKEPKGAVGGSRSRMFVVQKHDASHLHYDFRLSIDGVLVSWAVPKGPSVNPSDKRLAIMTEDHPLHYGKFEGTIPEGEYGGGTVMLWDTGTYRNIKKKDGKLVPMDVCLKNGQIEIVLSGERLQGAFALVRTPRDKQWLLIKMKDEFASKKNLVKSETKSAVTGRTMKEIAAEDKK